MQSSNYPNINHRVSVNILPDRIELSDKNGRLVATLTVVTMEKDNMNKDGKYEMFPTESFWINFEAEEGSMKNAADVFLD